MKNAIHLHSQSQNNDAVLSSSTLIAEIAQLVEHNLAKVGVASSSLVFRSTKSTMNNDSFEGKLKSCHFLYQQK